MYCKHCGKDNGDRVFCWNCGKRVNSTSAGFPKYGKELIDAYTVARYSNSGDYLIGDLGVGYVILNKNNKKLVIDTLFEDVITEGREQFDSILVKKNGKWGLINPLTGIIVCDFIYDDISLEREEDDNGNGEIVVYSNGLCGKIDSDGKIILPIIYDEIGSFGRVKKQGLWGLVKNGEQIIPCEYIVLGGSVIHDDYWSHEPSRYKNGKWGAINLFNGTISLEFEYDEVKFVEGGYLESYFYYIMRKGDKWGGKVHDFRFPCEFSLEDIKKAIKAYVEHSQWTLYAENGRKMFLAADDLYVSCYTQEGNNKPQQMIFGFAYLDEGYELDFRIMYSYRYGNNIYLVGDTEPKPDSDEWMYRFSIFKINAETFYWEHIADGAAVHFEKDGFKFAQCERHWNKWFIHDFHYDVNGKVLREDDDNEYQLEDMAHYYGESLVNAQKMVARGLLRQV